MKNRKPYVFGSVQVLFYFVVLTISPLGGYSQIYLDSTASVNERVNDLIGRMNLDEKIGQMVQTERNFENVNAVIKDYYLGSILSGGGSVPGNNSATSWVNMYNGMQNSANTTRLKIPIIYGIDAVHGNNNVFGATIFPHNIGLGCTRDTVLVKQCAQATAIEVAAVGLNWTFSPCIAVPRDIRWGRTYEGFGETPELQQVMARAAVTGYQGDSTGSPYRILACAKHFIGDGGTEYGTNAGNTILTETDLRRIHLPGYIAAINSGVGSVMVSFNSWNGALCHGHDYLITDLLKGELGFDGFVVSDWEGVKYLSDDFKTAIKISVNAGIDMFMEPTRPIEFITNLKELVNAGMVPMSRIDDAVKRILAVKFRMHLFERRFASMAMADSLGNENHRNIAREAVRKSIVLLKNEGDLLPLSKTSGKILVAGTKANEIGSQCGGWTISWQGSTGQITTGTTILNAVKSARGSANVIYSANGTTTASVNFAIVVVGETPYAEGQGDSPNPQLTTAELNIIQKVKELNIPYVVLLISGRPMLVTDVIADADAFVACWLPGTEALGITDVLFGDYRFTGKLSHTWPSTISQEPINLGDNPYNPLFPFGYGLTSSINSVSDHDIQSFSVFPNPATDFITVQSEHDSMIAVYHLFGTLVYKAETNNTTSTIDIRNLKSGVYIIKLVNEHGSMTSKFVKQ
jgi:beta-glucosidase